MPDASCLSRRWFLAAPAALAAQNPVGSAAVEEEICALLRDVYAPVETGYRRLSNGVLVVAALHRMPGVASARVQQWLEDDRYSLLDLRRLDPTGDGCSQWVTSQRRAVLARTGDGLRSFRVERRPAEAYFDKDALEHSTASAVYCARLGPVDAAEWSGHLIHVCRDLPGQCEVRTRIILGDFDPPRSLPAGESRRLYPNAFAAALVKRSLDEFAALRALLG